MTSVEILSHTDRTSWSRVAMVWRFYLPRIRTVLWAYPLLSLLLFAISAYGIRIFGFYGTAPLSLLNYMVIFSPLALTLRHDGELTATLPAFGLEKCIVIFGFSFVIAPLLTWLPAQLAETISGIDFDSTITPVYLKAFPGYKILMLAGYVATVAQIAVCLWVVCAARRPRLGILAPFAVSIYTALTMGICGFIAGFTGEGTVVDEATPVPAMTDALSESLPMQFLTAAYVLLAIFTIFAIWKTARAICHRQY